MKIEKPYVKIHSNVTIQVTAGLQNQDVTNPDAHVPDRLKISPVWPTSIVKIKQGQHTYPSEIVNWNTVQSLAKQEIITIGQFVNEADGEAEQMKANIREAGLEEKVEKVEKETKKEVKKEIKLSEIAGEEE